MYSAIHTFRSAEGITIVIDAVDHINLVVSDLERSVQFYTELLGFKEMRRARLEGQWIESIIGLKDVRANVVYVVAPAGEPRLELLCYESRGVNPFQHTPGQTPLVCAILPLGSKTFTQQ